MSPDLLFVLGSLLFWAGLVGIVILFLQGASRPYDEEDEWPR